MSAELLPSGQVKSLRLSLLGRPTVISLVRLTRLGLVRTVGGLVVSAHGYSSIPCRRIGLSMLGLMQLCCIDGVLLS